MIRPHSFIYHIFIFVLAQIAWLVLLGIWIYRYVSNYIIFSKVDDRLSAQILSEGRNVFILVGGLILLVMVSLAMSLLFHRLIMQFNLTRLYDNFIANITHELKSPLASIQLSLETLSLHKLPRSQQQEFISMMLRDSCRLNYLINSILEIPAIEHKKIAHNYRIFQIEPLIHELILEAREQFNLSGDRIRIEGGASCECVIDRDAFRIVLNNLIDNSIKYTTGPVHIVLTLNRFAKRFTLDFSDQGIGIPVEDQKRVFEKFFRIHDQNSPNVKGTGLGLYWVREIIRYHGGKISITSKGRGKGTTFHIELPLYPISKKRHIRNLLKIARKRQDKDSFDGQ
ncbi:MAG TPA: HAMP domain-containing histidine kinase [bacterium]|nr:HAMP domain-containing histidine kinase [bacterium]